MSTSILGRSAGTSSSKRGHPGYGTAMLLGLLFGAVFYVVSAGSFSDLGRQGNFASVQGQVVEVDQGSRSTSNTKRRRTVCEFVVAYTVGGKDYRVVGEADGGCAGRAGDAKTVRYNPSHPASATLSTTSDQQFWAWGVAAGAVLVGIVSPVVLTARAIARRKKLSPDAGTLSAS